MIPVKVEEQVRLFVVKVGEWDVGAVRCHGARCAEAWLFEEWAPARMKEEGNSSEMRMDPMHAASRTVYYLETEDGIGKAVRTITRAARLGRQERGDTIRKTGAAK